MASDVSTPAARSTRAQGAARAARTTDPIVSSATAVAEVGRYHVPVAPTAAAAVDTAMREAMSASPRVTMGEVAKADKSIMMMARTMMSGTIPSTGGGAMIGDSSAGVQVWPRVGMVSSASAALRFPCEGTENGFKPSDVGVPSLIVSAAVIKDRVIMLMEQRKAQDG